MIAYLQTLNIKKHQDIIVTYAKWVLKENLTEGIKIFVERFDEVTILRLILD
jgi:hypothetical protein